MQSRISLAGMALVLALCAGCATTGSSGDQVANSVYATHRIVKNLESDLGPRVTQLNETAAELTAKVEASENTTRQLQSLVEENQVQLKKMQETLDRLASVVYQDLGRSGAARSTAEFEPATVEPPAGTAPGTLPPPGAAAPGSTVPGAPMPPTTADAGANALTEYNKAQQAFLNDDYQTALTLYDSYLQRYPNTEYAASAQFWKAESYRKLSKFEEAIGEFEKVRSGYPGPENTKAAVSMTRQADCHMALGQTQRAVDLWQQLIENYPLSEVTEQAQQRLREVKGN